MVLASLQDGYGGKERERKREIVLHTRYWQYTCKPLKAASLTICALLIHSYHSHLMKHLINFLNIPVQWRHFLLAVQQLSKESVWCRVCRQLEGSYNVAPQWMARWMLWVQTIDCQITCWKSAGLKINTLRTCKFRFYLINNIIFPREIELEIFLPNMVLTVTSIFMRYVCAGPE